MATIDQVRRAAPQDLHEIISALSRAFFDDPIFAWALPDADRRQRVLPEFFALYSKAYPQIERLARRWPLSILSTVTEKSDVR